jgi:hypothetical protein
MAITDKTEGVWLLDEVYNKQNQGGIWSYSATDPQQMWQWGFQEQGSMALGIPYPAAVANNKNQDYSSPVRVGTATNWGVPATHATGPLGASEPGFAYFGEQTAMLMMKQDGTLWGCGENKGGTQMRGPQNSPRSSPVQLPGTWARIGGTKQCVHGIKTNNTLWGWGLVQYGQLGNNETQGEPHNPSGYSSPIQIPGSWNRVYNVGSYGGMATKTDGTLWAWGNNGSGCLGQNVGGENNRRSSPAQIGTENTWSDAGQVGGNGETLMTKTDGTLWMWGRSNGFNTGVIKRSSPAQIGTDTDWGTFAGAAGVGGYQHMACIKQDGTLWMWGVNYYGQLGLNENTNPSNEGRSSPTQIPGTTWKQVSCGLYGTSALKTDNTLWVWGKNEKGQFGNNEAGPNQYRSSPTQIPGSWVGQEGFDRQTTAALRIPT